jgi:hypothetical protein
LRARLAPLVHREADEKEGELPRDPAPLHLHEVGARAVIQRQELPDGATEKVEALGQLLRRQRPETPRIPAVLEGDRRDLRGIGIAGEGREEIAPAEGIDDHGRQARGPELRQVRLGHAHVHLSVPLHAGNEPVAMGLDHGRVEPLGERLVAGAGGDAVEEADVARKVLPIGGRWRGDGRSRRGDRDGGGRRERRVLLRCRTAAEGSEGKGADEDADTGWIHGAQ